MVSQPYYTPSGRRYTCRPLPPYSSAGSSISSASSSSSSNSNSNSSNRSTSTSTSTNSGTSSGTNGSGGSNFYQSLTHAADHGTRLPPSYPVHPPAFSSCHAMGEHQVESDMPSSHRKRIAVACGRCRKRKIRCSGDPGGGMPCSNCKNAGFDPCLFLRVGCVMSSQETSFRNEVGSEFDYNVSVARSMATRSSAALVPSSALAYHASTPDHAGGLAGPDPLAFSRGYAPPTSPYSRTHHHQHAGHHGYYAGLASTPYSHYADTTHTHNTAAAAAAAAAAADYGYLTPAHHHGHHAVGLVPGTWGAPAPGPSRRYDPYGMDASDTLSSSASHPHHPHHQPHQHQHPHHPTASSASAYPPLTHRPAMGSRGLDASAFSFSRVAASLPSNTPTAGPGSTASLSSSTSSGADRGSGYDAYGSAAAYAAARASTSTASSSGSSTDAAGYVVDGGSPGDGGGGGAGGGGSGGRPSLFTPADHYNLGHNGLESGDGYGYGNGAAGDDRARGPVETPPNDYVPGLPAPLPLPSPSMNGRRFLPSVGPGEGVGGRGSEGRSRR